MGLKGKCREWDHARRKGMGWVEEEREKHSGTDRRVGGYWEGRRERKQQRMEGEKEGKCEDGKKE